MLLKRKIAIVTGGSRGIPAATVEAFLAEGATVVLCGSRPESAQKAVAQLKERDPQAAVSGISPDLACYDQVKDAFDAVAEQYGRIDILVNNAGISESTPFSDYTDQTFHQVMDLNVKGVYHCTRAVVDSMTRQGGGVILNTSSMVSIYGQPSGVAYPTSKFAVNGLTVSLARELSTQGHSRQRRRSRHHLHRHDAGGSQGISGPSGCPDSPAPDRAAGGYRQCLCFPRLRRRLISGVILSVDGMART